MLSQMPPQYIRAADSCSSGVKSPMNQQTIRVLSYNLHAGRGMDNAVDLPRLANIIANQTPDAVSVQETDWIHPRSGNVKMMQVLCDLTKMDGALGANLNWNDGKSEYGNGFLCGWQFEVMDNLHFEHEDNSEPRGALIVKVHGPVPFYFVSTHLPLGTAQKAMLQMITAHLEEKKYTPAIMAGDFNSLPDSQAIEYLREKWTVANDVNPMFTFPADNPNIQIDYIAFTPKNAFTVLDCRCVPEKTASDHRPISAVLKIS